MSRPDDEPYPPDPAKGGSRHAVPRNPRRRHQRRHRPRHVRGGKNVHGGQAYDHHHCDTWRRRDRPRGRGRKGDVLPGAAAPRSTPREDARQAGVAGPAEGGNVRERADSVRGDVRADQERRSRRYGPPAELGEGGPGDRLGVLEGPGGRGAHGGGRRGRRGRARPRRARRPCRLRQRGGAPARIRRLVGRPRAFRLGGRQRHPGLASRRRLAAGGGPGARPSSAAWPPPRCCS